MEGGIFLKVKDIQVLFGCTYRTASTELCTIRDALGKKTKHITIKEYCKYEDLDFDYIWETLRGEVKRRER